MSTDDFIEHLDKINEKHVTTITTAINDMKEEIKFEIKSGLQKIVNKLDEISEKKSRETNYGSLFEDSESEC